MRHDVVHDEQTTSMLRGPIRIAIRSLAHAIFALPLQRELAGAGVWAAGWLPVCVYDDQ